MATSSLITSNRSASNIKEIINLLSIILKENGFSVVPAEIFRLSKFNKNEATSILWNLLFEVIYFCKYGEIEPGAKLIANQLTLEDVTLFVKEEMQKRGYFSAAFALLPGDGDNGSRELLLAFVWLFIKEQITTKLVAQELVTVQGHLSSLPHIASALSQVEVTSTAPQKSNAGVDMKRLMMMHGKVQLRLRQLYALQQEEANLTHKIHNATSGVSLSSTTNHLSTIQVYLLRHPEQLTKLLKQMEKENQRLEHLTLWKQNEHAFCKWLETVLQLKLKDADDMNTSTESRLVYFKVPENYKQDIKQYQEVLLQNIISFESEIERLDELWQIKKEALSPLEMESLILHTNSKISAKKEELSVLLSDNVSKRVTHPNLIWEKPKPNKKPVSGACIGTDFQDPVDIKHHTSVLRNQLTDLEDEISNIIKHSSREMEILSQRIPSAVCIRPLALQKKD